MDVRSEILLLEPALEVLQEKLGPHVKAALGVADAEEVPAFRERRPDESVGIGVTANDAV